MRPEEQILCLCSLPQGNGIDREGLSRLARRVTSWKSLLDTAARHRLTIRLYSYLKRMGGPALIGADVWSKIVRAYHSAQARTLALEGELETVLLPALNRAGIDALLLKGAALIQTVYRNYPVRSFIDLDLMVRTVDLERAKALLQGLSYQRTLNHFPSRWHLKELGRPELGEVSFTYWQSDRGIALDLHIDAFEGWQPLHFKPDWLWENAHSVSVGETRAFLPSPTNLFLHLLFHLAKHIEAGQPYLGWYLDLDECLRYFGGEIDASYCSQVIQSNREYGPLADVLAFLETHLSTPLPEPLWKFTRSSPPVVPPLPEYLLATERPSDIASFSVPQNVDRRKIFISYWAQMRGVKKKVLFLLWWLLPDASYLRAKYPFVSFGEKFRAYAAHLAASAAKGIRLGFYLFRRERAGSGPREVL